MLEWFSGLVLGVITAILLVIATSIIYPSMEDYSVDFGLGVNVGLVRVGFAELPKESITLGASQPIHYVFLDVDPGGNESSSDSSGGACRALTKRAPPAKTYGPSDLQCQPTRPLNRILLAEVLDTLKELTGKIENSTGSKGIRAIVLDVALAEDPATDGEDDDLIEAMKKWKDNPPIIYAADAERLVRGDDAGVKLLSEQEARYPGQARVAFPVADSAIRRYQKCFTTWGSAKRLESLPYQVAITVNGKPKCDAERDSPSIADDERIIYTLPSLEAHADSGPEIGARAFKLKEIYKSVYTRCLAVNLWNPASQCNLPETYENTVVVVGASNPFRRDRHYTPLGMMSGAEVVINATRSFLLYPDQKVKSLTAKMWKKAWITFACSLVWLAYHLFHHRMAIHGNTHLSVLARIRIWVLNAAAFLVTLAAVVVLAIWLSFDPDNSTPNLDVLLPVLAIGLETYADFSKWLLDGIKFGFTRLFESASNGRINVDGDHS